MEKKEKLALPQVSIKSQSINSYVIKLIMNKYYDYCFNDSSINCPFN